MKTKSIPSRWLAVTGRRLDPGPYLSGSIEAKETLAKLAAKKDRLSDLTLNGNDGIFHAGRLGRRYVDTAEFGVPFLGSTDILSADLSNLPYLANKLIAEHPEFLLSEGWTLITRSGTVGRMAYARPDMDGMACSEHVMRVVPDPEKVPPGYLYVFLSSRFGVPMVTSGTYGAIIQHIEPQHIVDLPIPRIGTSAELLIDSKIQKAADCLSAFQVLISNATNRLLQSARLSDPENRRWACEQSHLGWSSTHLGTESFRAFNHDPRCHELDQQIRSGDHSQLGALCIRKYFKGKIIFRRIDCDPEFGWRLVGQREAFRVKPEGRFIAKWSVKGLGLQVPAWTVLIPSHGTLGEYELYCRALLVTPGRQEYAYSGDFFRCIPETGKISGAYLFAFMRSEVAFRLLRGISVGGKQQEQHWGMMYRFPIPRLPAAEEDAIATMVTEAAHAFDEALVLEEEAQHLLEQNLRI